MVGRAGSVTAWWHDGEQAGMSTRFRSACIGMTALLVDGLALGGWGCMCSPDKLEVVVKASALEVEAGGSITLTAEAAILGPGANLRRPEGQPIKVDWSVTPSAGAGTGSCSPE